jgi:uncharacterized protein
LRIAVLSDTHNRLPAHVVEAVRAADEIWHLGDVMERKVIADLAKLERPLRVVRGNCDTCEEWPETERFVVFGCRIHLEHIPPRKPPIDTDLFLHGHTHVPRDEVIRGVRFLNPGTVGKANKGAPASYAWLSLNERKLPIWEIVRV